jgi:hypothetical protein
MGPLELLMNFGKAQSYSDKAEKLTHNTEGWMNNGTGDALRHAIAGGLIARNISPEAAESAHWLNENILGIGQPRTERRMDDHNTAFGIKYGPSFPNDQAFIDYLEAIKNSGLLKKLNRSHRLTALE